MIHLEFPGEGVFRARFQPLTRSAWPATLTERGQNVNSSIRMFPAVDGLFYRIMKMLNVSARIVIDVDIGFVMMSKVAFNFVRTVVRVTERGVASVQGPHPILRMLLRGMLKNRNNTVPLTVTCSEQRQVAYTASIDRSCHTSDYIFPRNHSWPSRKIRGFSGSRGRFPCSTLHTNKKGNAPACRIPEVLGGLTSLFYRACRIKGLQFL